MFYKIMNNLTPEYLRHPIPSRGHYGFRSPGVLNVIPYNTVRYNNSFYPYSVKSWNNIGPELRGAKSLSIFKKSILKIIRPVKKGIFNIHNRIGIGWIFQLRVGLSPLKSHKMNHKFLDTPVDTCQCSHNAETTHHFLLECQIFTTHRQNLLGIIDPILFLNDLENISDRNKVHLLLYGHEKLNCIENREVLKATINFISHSGRFSRV